MSSIGNDKHLTCTTDLLFKRLKKDKIFNLAYLKENSLKDLIVTAPSMVNKSFSASSLTESFIMAGMLDKEVKCCPDVYGLIVSRSTGVKFLVVNHGS